MTVIEQQAIENTITEIEIKEKIMYSVSDMKDAMFPPNHYRYEKEKDAKDCAIRLNRKTGKTYYIYEICTTWERVDEI